jgi:hypothetical protein
MHDIYTLIKDLTSGQDWQVNLDILTAFANKPVNYEALKDLRRESYLTTVRDFVKQRNSISSLEVENAIARVEDRFWGGGIDIYLLQGIKLPQSYTSSPESGEASNYYASEEYFQYALYDICQEKIRTRVIEAIQSLGPFEKKILKTYIEEYLPFAPNPHKIKIAPEKFLELSKAQFNSEGVAGLNYASIINALVRSGLGYEYEPGFVCPLWFTVKADLGRHFRAMVELAISAEIECTRH